MQARLKALHHRLVVVAAVLRAGCCDTDGVELDRIDQFGDAVEGGHAKLLPSRVRAFLVEVAYGRQVCPFAALVDTGVRVANAAHPDNCYVQHEAPPCYGVVKPFVCVAGKGANLAKILAQSARSVNRR